MPGTRKMYVSEQANLAKSDITPGAKQKWAEIATRLLIQELNPNLALSRANANSRSTYAQGKKSINPQIISTLKRNF